MLFGATPPADNAAPYAASYTIVDNTNTDGSFYINSMDNVDNIDSGAPVSVISDTIVPSVTLNVAEAGGYDFNLTWDSTDSLSGPSGVYDVEYRVENPECSTEGMGRPVTLDSPSRTSWQLWQNDITETGMQFTAIPGHSLYFRVSSKDRVDNEGQSAELGPYTTELETKKYYHFGGQRAAMRVVTASTNQVYYLHGDHLGSVSLTTDSSGAVVAQSRYMPYGEVRWESSPSPTDFAFTGQRLDGFGLMDFNARFYSSRLGRFVSADSVIPNPGSAIDFDRYAYAAGNPLRYIDPSGHLSCSSKYVAPGDCSDYHIAVPTPIPTLVLFDEDPNNPQSWTEEEMRVIRVEVQKTASAYAIALRREAHRINSLSHETGISVGYGDMSAADIFLIVHGGPVRFTRSSRSPGNVGQAENGNHITIYNTTGGAIDYIVRNPNLVSHELGHLFNQATNNVARNELPDNLIFQDHGNRANGYHGFAGGWEVWQYGGRPANNNVELRSEIFADMFIGWVNGSWWDNNLGRQRNGYMQKMMKDLLVNVVKN